MCKEQIQLFSTLARTAAIHMAITIQRRQWRLLFRLNTTERHDLTVCFDSRLSYLSKTWWNGWVLNGLLLLIWCAVDVEGGNDDCCSRPFSFYWTFVSLLSPWRLTEPPVPPAQRKVALVQMGSLAHCLQQQTHQIKMTSPIKETEIKSGQ